MRDTASAGRGGTGGAGVERRQPQGQAEDDPHRRSRRGQGQTVVVSQWPTVLEQVRPIPLFSTIRAHFVPLVVGSELGLHSREALQGSTEPTALWTPQVTSEPQALWSALVRTTLQPLMRARSGSGLPNALGRSAMTAAFRGITTVRGATLGEFLLGGGRGQLAPKGAVMGEPRGKKAERTARAAALAGALARSGVTVPPLAVSLRRTRRGGQPKGESCRPCPQPRRMVGLNIRFPVHAIDDRA